MAAQKITLLFTRGFLHNLVQLYSAGTKNILSPRFLRKVIISFA